MKDEAAYVLSGCAAGPTIALRSHVCVFVCLCVCVFVCNYHVCLVTSFRYYHRRWLLLSACAYNS